MQGNEPMQAIDLKAALALAVRWMVFFAEQANGTNLGAMLEKDADYVRMTLQEFTKATLYKDDPQELIVLLKTALGRAVEAGIVDDGAEPPTWQVALDAYLRADGFGPSAIEPNRVPHAG